MRKTARIFENLIYGARRETCSKAVITLLFSKLNLNFAKTNRKSMNSYLIFWQ